VDLDGKVIGINIARAGRTESYAIPSEDVRRVLPELMSGKLAPKEEVKEDPKKTALEKKVAEIRAALTAAEGAQSEAEKRLSRLKAALRQAEEERDDAAKKVDDVKALLDKVEALLRAQKTAEAPKSEK
jgi:serine protease Do